METGIGFTAGAEEAIVIGTPKGNYTPTSDDLVAELKKAARGCGYANFKVYIDGNEITEESQLQTNSIAAVNAPIRIEPYNKAG